MKSLSSWKITDKEGTCHLEFRGRNLMIVHGFIQMLEIQQKDIFTACHPCDSCWLWAQLWKLLWARSENPCETEPEWGWVYAQAEGRFWKGEPQWLCGLSSSGEESVWPGGIDTSTKERTSCPYLRYESSVEVERCNRKGWLQGNVSQREKVPLAQESPFNISGLQW